MGMEAGLASCCRAERWAVASSPTPCTAALVLLLLPSALLQLVGAQSPLNQTGDGESN